ncbi:hypothetical protein FOA43_003442 [Brettanomyces nanus]|uniref:Uncharacterized protein n=1 Tax=Eeniella nana TaxID=13502 RepID=A0A875S415_EENNA|nr:uncharacterized protein FOA43_003442 [Brettanomyces nanus]QPG76056.1 hypothetical protein FOA43_003442 [Brettanomyces nanus]
MDSVLNLISEYSPFPVNSSLNTTREYARGLSKEIAFILLDNETLRSVIHPVVIFYVSMSIVAATLIAIGSYATIEKPANAIDPNPNHPLFDQSDKDRTLVPDASISTSTAAFMPLIAGIGLVSLYFLIQHIDKDKLAEFLSNYLLVAGYSADSFTLSFVYKVICRKLAYWTGKSSLTFNPRYNMTFSKDSMVHPAGLEPGMLLPETSEEEKIIKEEALLSARNSVAKEDQLFNVYFTKGDIYSNALSCLLTLILLLLDYNSNWVLRNIASSLLAIYGIAKCRLTSFKVAITVLVLFFAYDIYFVFGSDIMMSVATNIDIPVKLMIPNSASRTEGTVQLSLLGLGDIILPGCVIALCLRFDLYIFHEKNPNTEFHHLQSYPKPYFYDALIFYSLGLAATCSAMYVFEQGQPALLYLSPSLLIAIFVTAGVKGELRTLWDYQEDTDTDIFKKDKDIEIDILCSKETLYLAGKIDDKEEEEEEEEDEDYEPEEVDDDEEEAYDI